MKGIRVACALAVAAAVLLGLGTTADAVGRKIKEKLTGYEEVPAVSTPGEGEFRAQIKRGVQEITYTLTYGATESNVTQAHIHFENPTNNGPIVVFLCTNLGNGPVGTQACPATGGTITGTIRPVDIGAGAAGAGIAAGEFDEFVEALRAGSTYVNVHTEVRTGGEIRAQIGKNATE